jgi:hypothetical protein
MFPAEPDTVNVSIVYKSTSVNSIVCATVLVEVNVPITEGTVVLPASSVVVLLPVVPPIEIVP